MPGRYNDTGRRLQDRPARLAHAGCYSKAELLKMHDKLTGLYHSEGYSGAAAFEIAEEHLYHATGQTIHGPYGPGYKQQREPSRRYTEEREPDFDGRRFNSKYQDHYDSGYSSSSRHGSRCRCGHGASRDYGREGPEFDWYFTEEPYSSHDPSHNHSYYEDEDDGFHNSRGHSRNHTSSRSGGYEHNYNGKPSHSSNSESRSYRTEERRPGGFSSDNYNGYDERSYWKANGDGKSDSTGPDDDDWGSPGIKPAEDLYVVLGVAKTATMDALKQAHRKLSIANHPDRVKGGAAAKKAATERMAATNQAYDVLKDAELRYWYDKTGTMVSKNNLP